MKKQKKAKLQRTSIQEKSSVSHQNQLDRLQEKDPEFYKFLQEEDSSLLKFDYGSGLSSDSDDDEVHQPPSELEVASDSDDSVSTSEVADDGIEDAGSGDESVAKGKRSQINVDQTLLSRWQALISGETPSLNALRQVFQAFHACLARIDANTDTEEKTEKKSKRKKRHRPKVPADKYKVVGSSIFNSVISVCMQNVSQSLGKILNYFPKQMKQTKKQKPPLPTTCQRWTGVRDALRLYLSDMILLAEALLEPSVTRVFLRHILLMLPYYLSFPKICKKLFKLLVNLWSSADNESIRVLAFFCMMRFMKMDKDRLHENTLKQTYLSYVANCKFTSPTTLPMINFMQQTFAEICAIDCQVTYRFAFLYIRQLAVHLRKAIMTNNKETRKTVYNWQFVHCISLWCRVLSVLSTSTILQPLIYPLVQIALGSIDLVPTPRFYPLRFHIVRNLIALGDCTNVYIPLLPYITSPLLLQEFKKKQVGVAMKPLAFEAILKISNSQLKEKSYRDSTIDHIYDLLLKFFNSQAHTIAFPEMAVPTLVILKKFAKESQIPNYSKVMSQIVEKVTENGAFITSERSNVDFNVMDVQAVDNWESKFKDSGVPFHKVFSEYKKRRERELAQQIADKNRNVEENLPQIDRAKFLSQESKSTDRQEFGELFEESDGEDVDYEVDFETAVSKKMDSKRKHKHDEEENPTLADSDCDGKEFTEGSSDEIVEAKKVKKSKKRKSDGKIESTDPPVYSKEIKSAENTQPSDMKLSKTNVKKGKKKKMRVEGSKSTNDSKDEDIVKDFDLDDF